MSGGGSRPGSGSGGGGSGGGSGGSTPPNPYAGMPGYSSNSSLNPSWSGGSTPSTFEPKDFGTNLLSDQQRIYKQGPQVFGQSLFTPMGAESRGLIGQGLGDVQANRSGVLGDIAGGGWLGGDKNPYFDDALRRTRGNIATDVGEQFQSSGLWGSDLHAKGLAQGMGNVENDARLANFENEFARMMGAQGALQQGTATGLGYGNLLDTEQQGIRQGEYDLFNRKTNAPYEHIMKNLGPLMGNPAGADEASNQGFNFMDFLGTAGTVAGATLPWLLPMLSDKRAKTDIERVGKTDEGTPIYKYRYKGGNQMQMGVMAQDVLKKQPEAVSLHPSGLFQVDYSQVR